MSISVTYQKKQTAKSSKSGPRNFHLFKKKGIRDKQKARLYADLHLLLSSGLDIKTVFDILISQSSGEMEKNRFQSVQRDIIAGSSLADAMSSEKLAGSYEYFSLKIGEESGKINDVLSEIKRYYERKIKQRRQVSSALTYPVLVLVTAIIAVGFMLNVIVPMFEEVFKRFQGNLPLLTQRIIDLSEWMKEYGWLIVLVLGGTGISINLVRKRTWFRKALHQILLKIPVFGKLIKDIESARFCHIMALLTSARSPLVQSLDMVTEMIQFIPLKSAVALTSDGISKGNSFFESLESSGFFDKKFTSLIKAAEQVNRLEYAFDQLNDQYNQEIDHKLTILSSLMEPILVILVGGIVAVILIAMYLPLFQIGTSIY